MSDCCSQPGLLPFEQALAQMLEDITPVAETITVAVTQAAQCVLANDIVSPINVPPHHNSAMDGYAYAQSSLEQSTTLVMVGKSFAGAPYQGEVKAGECIRIMTGAKLPSDCDTVQMQENCTADNNKISFNKKSQQGQHVRYAGEDVSLGHKIYEKGHRLTSVDIGMLTSVGVGKVEVYRPIKVALIATGDELKSPEQPLLEGDIYESNSSFLAPMLKKLNCDVINFGIIADDLSKIRQAFISADEQADVVISSGGVSVGEADYTKDVLDELGEIGFWKIAIKPGKPFAFGKLANSIFFGLPGNPVSALATFYQLSVHGIHKLQNAAPIKRQRFKVKTTTLLKKSRGRTDFQRGVVTVNAQGEMEVASTGSQGSGILSSIARANCFIILEQDRGRVEIGELVDVELFDDCLK
ncbi:molybdopterin molybdotransferase MoeA [Thalassotalea atypica]|uniref:molybdopterin molybdotransferase MoeA n=1 Tax=Thalassotalea atypica TaxID=2054316 RepID=UPI002573C2E7|nr:molybdopterin molybdotransferase MoeA [Thalassotalea atypica]